MIISSRNLVTLAGASLLLASSALAASTEKGSLHLYDRVEVQGQQLVPGDYKLEWNNEGPNVQVSITQGKKTVATVPAQLVPVAQKNPESGYVAKKAEDGQNALREIFFGGKTYELRLGEQSSPATTPSGASGTNQ